MEISYVSRNVEYVPTWNGNRDDPNPVRVTLRFLNTAQRTTLLPWHTESDGRSVMNPDRRGLLLAAVERIENLIMLDRDTGTRHEVRTARDLLEAVGLEVLAIELTTQVVIMSGSGGPEKNS